MNLYQPTVQLDSPFGYGDLEWLYRQQDVDGSSLTSPPGSSPRSASQTRWTAMHLQALVLDSWELNNYAWANDNPAACSRTTTGSQHHKNASFAS